MSYLSEKTSDDGNAAEAAFEVTLPDFVAILAGILTGILTMVLTVVLVGILPMVLAMVLTFILTGVLTGVLVIVLAIVLTEAAALVHSILTASVCVLGSVNIPTLKFVQNPYLSEKRSDDWQATDTISRDISALVLLILLVCFSEYSDIRIQS